MEYANHLSEYAPAPSEAQVAEEVARIRAAAKGYETDEVYRLCYSAIDLTTLSCSDSVESVTAFARKAVEFYTNYPAIANVASICGRARRGRYADAHYERRGRISFVADLSGSEDA